MKKKATSKPKVQSCPCACVPPPRKRRRAPTYTPRQQPQFYAALPIPQTQFDTDTIRRVVQDEFARYHTPRKTLSVAGVGVQTDFPDDDSERTFVPNTVQLDEVGDDESEQSFGMTAALEEMRKEGSAFGVRRGEQIAIESQAEQELLRERERELDPMERAKRAFKPVPSMAQQTELRGFMEGAMSRAEARGLPFTLPPGVQRELVGFE